MVLSVFIFTYSNFISALKQIPICCLILFLCSNYCAPQIYAARSITISSDESQLFSDDQLEISASVSGFAHNERIWIKGAFHKNNSTNYFGYTRDEDEEWIKNSEKSQNQREVSVGEWDGRLVARPDYADSGFIDSGDYAVKLGYYYTTSGGNMSSVNWSENELNIYITAPSSTPTIVETTKPTPQPTSIILRTSYQEVESFLHESQSETADISSFVSAGGPTRITAGKDIDLGQVGIVRESAGRRPERIASSSASISEDGTNAIHRSKISAQILLVVAALCAVGSGVIVLRTLFGESQRMD